MANAGPVTVGTVGAPLVAVPPGVLGERPGPVAWFSLSNGTGQTVYVGGQLTDAKGTTTLGTGNGYPVGTSAALSGYLWPGDSLYAITGTLTSTVTVLVTGAAGAA